MEFATTSRALPSNKMWHHAKIYCRWDSQHCQRKIAIVPCAVDLINFTECTERKKTDCWRLNIRLNKRRCPTTSSKIISVISADRLHELARGGRDAVVLERRKKNISQRVHRNVPKTLTDTDLSAPIKKQSGKKPRVRVSGDNKSGTRWSDFCQTWNIFPAIMVCAEIDIDTVACSSQSRVGTGGER